MTADGVATGDSRMLKKKCKKCEPCTCESVCGDKNSSGCNGCMSGCLAIWNEGNCCRDLQEEDTTQNERILMTADRVATGDSRMLKKKCEKCEPCTCDAVCGNPDSPGCNGCLSWCLAVRNEKNCCRVLQEEDTAQNEQRQLEEISRTSDLVYV